MTRKVKKTKKRLYQVKVLSTTVVEGTLRHEGETVTVSKDYHNRVQLEKDQQLKAL